MKGGGGDVKLTPLPRKNYIKKPSLIRVNTWCPLEGQAELNKPAAKKLPVC